MPMQLSVIIVNWNSCEYLRKCLRSIDDFAPDLPLEIIVVDNASYDGCNRMISAEFPGVTFIQSSRNLGFAGANNLGFKHSSGSFLLFLNPDTEITAGALQGMIAALASRPDAGIAGCRLLNADKSLQTSCVQSFPTILNEALDTTCLRRVFPRSRLWGTAALLEEEPTPKIVECVSGACLMIRRDIFEAVDEFTTAYFMYVEDRDLCHKVRQAGYKTYFVPSAQVIHYGGASSDSRPESNFSIVMRCESLCAFMHRRRGAAYAAAFRITMAAAALGRLAVFGVLLLAGRLRLRPVQSPRGRKKASSILRWALGMESWAHQYRPERPYAEISPSPSAARRTD